MSSLGERALSHVRHLAGTIGSRVIGSAGNHAAADYIAAQFRDAGLSPEFQTIPCPDWVEECTMLELDGVALEAAANTFSPPCDLTAPTVAVGTLAELRTAEITGRVVIFYGDLAQHEIAAQGAIYVSERDRGLIQLLETRAPAAVITVNPTLESRWRLIEDYDLALPSATVTARSGLRLVEREGAPVRLQIVSRRAPSHTANVIARLPGERPERIVLCAHYDSKVDTAGAYDNAAGVAVILTLLEALADVPRRYTLEWVAFTGEEIYGLGDMEYARLTGSGFRQIFAAMNFDGVGPRLAANSVATFAASTGFEQVVNEATARYPGVVRVPPWPASDHYIFYSNGVPSLAFSSVGIRGVYHTPADTVEWISPAKLGEAVRLARDVVTALQPQPFEWSRPA